MRAREAGRLPNLFIVGAPKCGTTAMHHYLGQHPDVYMSPVKEPCFFGSDLTIVNVRGHLRDRDAYLALFRGRSEKVVGEATIWYLCSRRATTSCCRERMWPAFTGPMTVDGRSPARWRA